MFVIGGGESNGKLNDIQRLPLPEGSRLEAHSVRADFKQLLKFAEDGDHPASDLRLTIKDRDTDEQITILHSYLALLQVRVPKIANGAFQIGPRSDAGSV